jgi:hypothetical protein
MEPKRILVIPCLILVLSIALVSTGIAYAGGVRGLGLFDVMFRMGNKRGSYYPF